jgi:nitrite reductase (NO-forming)
VKGYDVSDPSREPERDDVAPQDPDPEDRAEMPRWVKVAGIAVALLILLAMVVHLAGGGGPARHASGDAGVDHRADSPPIDGAPELAVTADALEFEPAGIELPADLPVNVALTADDVFHDLVIDEIDFHLGADAGETAVGGMVFAEPGTYVGYCSVPGHRDAGMEFEVVVTPSDVGHQPPPWAH